MPINQSINLFFHTILIIMHYCKKQVSERWLFNVTEQFVSHIMARRKLHLEDMVFVSY